MKYEFIFLFDHFLHFSQTTCDILSLEFNYFTKDGFIFMNFKEITFTNEYTKQYKTAPIGFSWTTLFFGCFPALFRGDWKWAGIQFILSICTSGLSCFVMPFLYNKLHIKDLLKQGFVPTDENQCKYLVIKGIVSQHELEYLTNKNNTSTN